jgi:ribonuclease III
MLPSFQNPVLLTTALTHRSALNERLSTAKESNERLEYLGDAVLELVVTQFLFDTFPEEAEGNLSAFRSALVKTTTLAEVARELGLGDRLFMSKGEEASGGRDNEGLLADTLEAVIGAIHIDQGYAAAAAFIGEHLLPRFERIYQQKLFKDAKSHLQELIQAEGRSTPEYQVINETGPDHDKEFIVQVVIDGKPLAQGSGRSKQTAQQAAAEQALVQLQAKTE